MTEPTKLSNVDRSLLQCLKVVATEGEREKRELEMAPGNIRRSVERSSERVWSDWSSDEGSL